MTGIEGDEHQQIVQYDASGDDSTHIEAVDPEHLIKHPLQHKWALWYFKTDRSKDWNDCLKLVANFAFVEDFWALYNFIQPASRLSGGCDYSVFKDGIQPAWEDVRNKRGGRWMLNVNKTQRHEDLDSYWLETLLCMIGEAFGDHTEDVCGAVVNIRGKGDKISLWTSDGANAVGARHIGKLWRERLQAPRTMELTYYLHDDAMSKSGSTAKSTYQE